MPWYTAGKKWFALVILLLMIIFIRLIFKPAPYPSNPTKTEDSFSFVQPHVWNDTLPQCTKRFPDVIEIGAKKCSTEAFKFFLEMHPRMVIPKEVHFFDTYRYHKGLDYYLKSLPCPLPSQILMDKSPRYFVTQEAPERIVQMNASIKLVLMVRNPVTRLLSDYAHLQEQALPQTYPPFEKVVINHETGELNTSYTPVDVGIYHKHFRRWLKVFPMSQFLILEGDEFVKDPRAGMLKAEIFLGLGGNAFTKDRFVFVKEMGFYCKRMNGITKCMDNDKGRPHPFVKQRILDKIEQFYRPHNKQFYKLIGKSFNW